MQINLKIFLLFAFIFISLNSEELDESEKELPQKKILRNANSITTIKIQFCQSSASNGYFLHVKEHLESKYSDVSVISEPYPLKNPRKTIYYIMRVIEGIIIILIAISNYIKPKLEMILGPDFFKIINQNKLTTIGFVFIIGLYVGQAIYYVDAFEVFCEDKLIYSTIEKNGIKPTLKTITQLVKKLA